MKFVKLLLVGTFIIPLLGCPSTNEPDSVITIVNNSGQSVIYFDQYNIRQDTLLDVLPFPLNKENTNHLIVPSNGEVAIGGPFINLFEELPDKVLMIYFFSKDTIDTVPWERIRDENLVLTRYDLTLEDLENRDWRIEYPE